MHYFRYKHTDRVYNDAWKAEFAQLTKDQQKNVRRNKILQTVGTIVFFAVMIICFVGCTLALTHWIPVPERIFLQILWYVLIVLLVIAALCLSGFVGAVVASPIFNKVKDHPQEFRRKSLHKACEPLRKFYGLQAPYILTKCFECSDEKFIYHDVCIFIHGDELRITTDLFSGFAYSDRDLGCYAFKADEISLTKQEREGHLTVKLQGDGVVFLLGYRAKGFVEKNFLSNDSLRNDKTLR